MKADELASNIVQSYEVSTAGLGENDTLSAIDTSQLGALDTALQTFVTDALEASPAEWNAAPRGPGGVPQYENPDYVDLGDYMANVAYGRGGLGSDSRGRRRALSCRRRERGRGADE